MSVRQTVGLETEKSWAKSLLGYLPVACMRQGSRYCRSESLGCLPRNRAGRTNAFHHRLAARRRCVMPSQHQPEQGQGTPRAQERVADRAPGRNPGPLQRRPALPHGQAQPVRRYPHLLDTAHIGEAVRQRQHIGLTVEPRLLAHISPLGWPTSCSLTNTGGQSADSGRFCLLSESTSSK